MADNVTIPATGSGTLTPLISTEEITTLNGGAVSAQHVQRAGMTLVTANGVAVDAPGSTADGVLVNLGTNNDVSAAQSGTWTVQPGNTANTTAWKVDGSAVTQPVSAASLPLPTGAATSAKQGIAGTDLTGGAGAVAAGTQRVTLASDDPAVASLAILDNIVSGSEAQVDVVAALPAGTNNIGDVDVLTVPADPFGANADAGSATGSISAKLRFIASTGIPITGTVTVGSHAVTNAGTFAVQSTLQTGDATVGRVKLTDGTDVADILDLASSNPLTVAIVDGAGDQITAFGGGTQYTEDAAAAANPVGTALNLIRDDARAGGITTTDGDNLAARGTNSGELYVKHVDTIPANITTALPAGTNAIGKLAANSGVDIGDVDVTSVAGMPTGANASQVQGTVAHDSADAQNPVKIGAKAIAFGANPTGVTAGDRTDLYASRAGIPWVLGGHPNVITTEYLWTSAQTDDAIVTVSAGTKIVVTQLQVAIGAATTVAVGLRIGFGATTLPTAPTDGTAVAGYLASHRGIVPGAGLSRGDGSGLLGVGADDEDLRITADAPTSGSASAVISYFTIES